MNAMAPSETSAHDPPAGMSWPPERWRARGADTASRLSSWSAILADTHLAFDVRPGRRAADSFVGAVTRRRVGDLMLLDCAASPFLGHRGQSVIGNPPASRREDVLGFQFVGRGVELVREGERELAVRPGDMILWDGLQPTEVEVVEPFHKRTLLFPRERVLAVCPRLAATGTLPSLEGSPTARLLVRYMNALVAEQPQLDRAAGAAAATAALELLRAAVEPNLPTSRAASRAALRAEIGRYVRTHLQDSQLDPASIARAYAMSVRTLHVLFEDADMSVAGLVRTERLARCLEDLQQPNGGSVTDIAFRWGFCDAAHFSRVFKREFNATPSEIRQTALTAGASGRPGERTRGMTSS
jgi:AraC family transcriptional regulator, positive regulator of tynA and feaB